MGDEGEKRDPPVQGKRRESRGKERDGEIVGVSGEERVGVWGIPTCDLAKKEEGVQEIWGLPKAGT